MRDEHSDAAIDQLIASAAKALTASEPTRALRSGVRERITRPRSAWSFVPVLAGVPVLAVAAVIVGRVWSGAAGEPASVRPSNQIVDAAPAPSAPAAVFVQPVVTQAARAQTRPRLTARRETPLEVDDTVIPPLTIAPLSTTQIAVDTGSGVMPIEIEPLQIEPLSGAGQ
jgi:hypothetical protein